MANRNLGQLRSDLRSRLDETNAVMWQDSELINWLNEGARKVARKSECLWAVQTIAAAVGTANYLAPADMIRIHKLEHQRSANDIWPLEYRDLSSMDSIWSTYRAAQSRPVAYTLWGVSGAMTMTVFPLPNENLAPPNGFVFHYYRQPVKMVADTDVLDLPDGWDELPIMYAEFVAMRKDRLPNWQEAKATFDEALTEMMTLTMRPTDQVGSYVGEPLRAGLPAWLVGDSDPY